MFFFDEDPDARVYRAEAGTITARDLDMILAHLKKSSVEAYIVNTGAAKVNFPSRIMEYCAEGFDANLGLNQPVLAPEHDAWGYRRCANFQALFRQGIDSNAYLLDGARKLGISPWIGVRMNDIHNGNVPESSMHPKWWKTHPEYWCAGMDHPWENTLNYAVPAVRERMKAFIAELLEKYNGDGLMLDFLRWPSIVPFGQGKKQAPVLTGFMREVRQLCDEAGKRRGHRICLGARVPLTPENALKHALDAPLWCREGILDQLIIGTFRRGMGFDAPVERWHEIIGDPDFPVSLSIDNDYAVMPGPFPTAGGIALRFRMDPETIRGVASAAFQRGASGIELFNYMVYLTDKADEANRKSILHDVRSMESLRFKDRLYRISWDDSDLRISEIQQIAWIPGYYEKWMAEREKAGIPWDFQLPRTVSPAEKADFVLHTGPEPEEGAEPSLHLTVDDGADAEKLIVTLNGVAFETPLSGKQASFTFPPCILKADRNEVSVLTETGSALILDVMIRLHFPGSESSTVH